MDTEKYILGIDTSNYKTSLALVGQEDIRLDLRKFLEVKPGERGLRQSEALFQHVRNLPELFEEVRSDLDLNGGAEISAVAFSSRPRPVEGSYMPCFIAGESFGRSLAAMLDVPAISFSHQEGHLEAIKAFTEMSYIDHFIACHFSGGTCEILYVKPSEAVMPYVDEYGGYIAVNGENTIYDITLVGGTKDISFGQVLDRAGVAMGLPFPCGNRLDQIAMKTNRATNYLTPVKVKDCHFNLSGIDTQIKNLIGNVDDHDGLVREIFEKISDCICRMLIQAADKTGLCDVIMSGGVSTSGFIRDSISDRLEREGIIVYFDDLGLSSDNAVGTALLGGKYIWE